MTVATQSKPADGLASQLAYVTRVLHMPTIGRVWDELAEHARGENWSHEEYLEAVLQRQLAEREAAGTTMRIRTAHFPAVKTLEDFNPARRLPLREGLDHGHEQPAVGRWGETFSDDVVASAMIDRLVHHAEVLTLTGDSYRTRARRELLAKDNRTAE